jgi:hypothetical protein
LEEQVELQTDACLMWPYSTYLGYPRLRGEWAHVFACERGNGPRPPGAKVHYLCDERKCINPRHLVWGTHEEIMRDRDRRGTTTRGAKTRRKVLKLTDAEVAEIRASTESDVVLARRHAVSKTYIWLLRARRYRV